ncbi:MAG: glycosyltransferase [Isosphaeraceae bacterium]|nr:glycosyltransferase [Isosphaeraceae bacterium]
MRIGIDMLGVQSPGSRGRGIGRFGQNLVAAMLTRGREHEFVLYAHDGYPIDLIPSAPNVIRQATIAMEPARGDRQMRDAMERLARTNPDRVDVLLLLNPFELCPGYDPPARPLNGPPMAVVVHDLIPFLFQEHYMADPCNAAWFYRRLRIAARYDVLLTNSEATRADCLRMLDLPADRVVTIGGAGNGRYFVPDRSFPLPWKTRQTLHKYGIDRPYIFCLAGFDDRKNLRGLLEAVRLLPRELRYSHQVVVTCFLDEDDTRKVRHYASERGLLDQLVLTGEVPDEELRILYQRCAVFAFPSLYEGLGLPLLEAMHCGAAVVAGNNSSQIEVVGDAGLLVNAHDAGDIANGLRRILSDPGLARSLGDRAIIQASRFSWEQSADRALAALTRVVGASRKARLRADGGHTPKPRVAMIAPWPPKRSGIATYATNLIRELKQTYTLDLYHDEGYVPEPCLDRAEFASYDHRLYRRNAAVVGYRGTVYHMGNSYYHGFMDAMLFWHPGIVVLHDFSLAAFRYWRAHHAGGNPLDNFKAELRYCHPERYEEVAPFLEEWSRERERVQEEFLRRHLYMNRRIFEQAEAVIVHSPWCLEQARRLDPEFADKVTVIPHGATPRLVSFEHRMATRERFGLPREGLVVAGFGGLSPAKMNVEAIEAFAVLARERPEAVLAFVGQDWGDGEAARRVKALGLEGRVRFLGRQADADYQDLIAATDIGIALRRPPTYGETSGALLDLLRHGIATIANDAGTFADYPDHVVRRVRWESEGIEGLVKAMRDLSADASARGALGQAAMRYVEETHAWSRAAASYVKVIERIFTAKEWPRSAAIAAREPAVVG